VTFADLQNDALDALGYAVTSGAQSEARVRIKRGINFWHRRILVRPGYARLLRDAQQTLTTVASTSTYGFSEPLGRLSGIYDVTNAYALELRDVAWLRGQDTQLAISGNPAVYVPKGWFPVAQHPTTAAAIFAASSAADTTQLAWEFLLSDGTRTSGVTALNGTTAVQLGSASTVVQVLALTYQGPSTGLTITIRMTSGAGTVLGQIAAGRTTARYFQVQLWPTPAAALTYTCDFTREIQDMAADQDEPLLPPDFHYLLSLGAQCEELKRRDDNRYSLVRNDLDGEIKMALNRWLWDLPSPRPQDQGRPSQLGAWFAAGT
jgi:hypothetical protein